ncbi:MAG TPA: ABC transporter ATP-binding protein [Coleofasciculaceae cyanobacterium]|jgi:lipopolysaccharide transport system ATP-binding protein
MSDTIIQVENLGKKYIINHQRQKHYTALRDVLSNGAKVLGRRLLNPFGKRIYTQTVEEFWALKDVSFEINRGDRVGIIGRNGAGKSTLLKILSRITEPSTGRVTIKGQVASLLEVGTGFHPELTGRENIFLNGAILGMSRAEIKKKFDEIVAFAEVEKFLDTPVKHYSSGMYVRLAFAVAAHLEPEILVVDEVLAVGDVAFQDKCLGKMEEVAKEGRTVLFVSHNIGAITNLCNSSIFLDKGQILFRGSASEGVSKYLSSVTDRERGEVFLEKISSPAYFTKISVIDSNEQPTATVDLTSNFKIYFEYDVLRPIAGLDLAFSLFDKHGSHIFYSSISKSPNLINLDHQPGHYIAEVDFPANFMAPGIYTITSLLYQANIYSFDTRDKVIGFSVIDSGSREYIYAGHDLGSILVEFEWRTQFIEN